MVHFKNTLRVSKKLILYVFITIPVFCLFPQQRHFSDLFPTISAEQRNAVFSAERYLYYGNKSENLTLMPKIGEPLGISKASLGKKPGFFVEALQVVPQKNIPLLRIFNALEKIQNLKGKTYYSSTSKKRLPLFSDAVRLLGPDKTNSFLPDPPLSSLMPLEKTMYVRLTDTRFGHCYFEISFRNNNQGILYRIDNFKPLTFGPITVVKEKTMTVLLYIEPVEEGLALYCLAGAEVSDFITKYVDIPSALNKRMEIFIDWLLEGIK